MSIVDSRPIVWES